MTILPDVLLNTQNQMTTKMNPITVLSLFDGISCGQIALKRAGIPVKTYYASEVKKSAILVTQKHFPNTIQLGDVTKIDFTQFRGKVDLLIGGSPCQDFTRILGGSKKGLKGSKSCLFWEYLRALKECAPRYFLLENVKMKKQSQDEISALLGVEPIRINSSLVSFQKRDRLYWTNIPNVTQPADRHMSFQDFKDTDPNYCRQFMLSPTEYHQRMWNNGRGRTERVVWQCNNVTYADKVGCLKRVISAPCNLVACDDFCRTLTAHEAEAAQTLPKGYLEGCSKNQVYDLVGDCWTVDVIAHIFASLKQDLKKGE